jgi:hypothetical protein
MGMFSVKDIRRKLVVIMKHTEYRFIPSKLQQLERLQEKKILISGIILEYVWGTEEKPQKMFSRNCLIFGIRYKHETSCNIKQQHSSFNCDIWFIK